MSVGRADLTAEEWEALQRLNRGAPESKLVPGTIAQRLIEAGLAAKRAGQRRVTDRGKALILRHRDDQR